jgi:uncharacterized membrane protein (UPF0127 family)
VPRPLALAAVALALAGCGGDDEPAASPSPPPPLAPEAVATITTSGGETVRVRVEIADNDTEAELGLMFRESLPDDAGMIFLFDRPQTRGFWMKNTLIPLSIAFLDGTGEIVRILDMQPCRADPCERYKPGVPYRGALEVNLGAFRRWGVNAGDRIELVR